MADPLTLQDVANMLDLPSADAVADLLREHGIKGEQSNCLTCPIAEFASKMVRALVYVTEHRMSLYEAPYWADGVALPEAAQEFIDWFDCDDDAYPDLLSA